MRISPANMACLVAVLFVAVGCSDSDPQTNAQTPINGASDTGIDDAGETPGDGDVSTEPTDTRSPPMDTDEGADAAISPDTSPTSDVDDPTFDVENDVDDGDVADAESIEEPSVAFLAPANDAVVDNPVLFEVSATGVDEVEIFADETYSLGPAFDPAEESELLYRFAGTGFARSLHVEGRIDGDKVTRTDLTITVNHDSCAESFFITEFDDINDDPSGELDMFSIREESLAAIKDEIETLQSCGADITLGAMLSLLMWEAAFRVGSYNTRCNENSYYNTESDCDEVAEALYSYQFGIGGMHTSNFHPCRGGSYTQGMRALFEDLAGQAGYATDASLLTDELENRFASVCPDATASGIDYYILGAHDPFGIPRNGNGNYLAGVDEFPFLDPAVSVPLTFNILHGQCATIDDDREAIAIWGGGDDRYATEEHQNMILAHYDNFAAANCD